MAIEWKPFTTAPKNGRPIIMFRPSAPVNKWVVVRYVSRLRAEDSYWIVCGSSVRFRDRQPIALGARWADLPAISFDPATMY